MPDYYATIIRERNAAEAASILADSCRKKDKAIAILEARVAELEAACATMKSVLLDAKTVFANVADIYVRALQAGGQVDYRTLIHQAVDKWVQRANDVLANGAGSRLLARGKELEAEVARLRARLRAAERVVDVLRDRTTTFVDVQNALAAYEEDAKR